MRLPCGEGGSCAVVRDQGFQCSCKADFTGESSQVTLILVFLVIFMHFDCEHKDGQGSISPIWQVAAASAAATSATPTPARTPASARGATGWRGPPPSRASARPDSGEGSARTSSTMTGYARGNAVSLFLSLIFKWPSRIKESLPAQIYSFDLTGSFEAELRGILEMACKVILSSEFQSFLEMT